LICFLQSHKEEREGIIISERLVNAKRTTTTPQRRGQKICARFIFFSSERARVTNRKKKKRSRKKKDSELESIGQTKTALSLQSKTRERERERERETHQQIMTRV